MGGDLGEGGGDCLYERGRKWVVGWWLAGLEGGVGCGGGVGRDSRLNNPMYQSCKAMTARPSFPG
jgi:hypothetical protein